MNKTMIIAALIAGLCVAGASRATAQATASAPPLGVFINLNGSAQTQSRDLTTSNSFSLYGEPAALSTAQRIDAGPVIDVSLGYKVWRNLGVAVGISRFKRSGSASIAATIPNPAVFNRPASVNVDQTGMTHSEIGTHIMAVWFVPVTDRIDVSLSVGPSFISVRQDIVSTSVVPNTQTLSVTSAERTATAKGANVGVDVNYLIGNRYLYGGGIFMRYAGGSVDLPEASGLNVGGFQIGAGARVRF
jgi:hypothetical protein